MPDAEPVMKSTSQFKRKAPELLRQLKDSGQPVVLTINGTVELVVRDAASYQKLIELAEHADRMEALRASIEDMNAGRVVPVEDMLAEMRQIVGETKPR
jgi:PHD/YefM family antitoxin component YafN of YafNO toxin-antitoxin module